LVVPDDQARGEDLANRCGVVKLKRLAADFVEGEIEQMLD